MVADGARLRRRLPDFPWDRADAVRRRARARAPRRHRRPVGRHARRPDARRSYAAPARRRRRARLPADDRARRDPAGRLDWLARRLGVTGLGLDAVLPTIGSKELVAWLPTTSASAPATWSSTPSSPTRRTRSAPCWPAPGRGRRLADRARARGAGLLWLNSPSNPTGGCCPSTHLRKVVDWGRERGAVLVSDECYLELRLGGRAGLGAAPRRLRRLRRRDPGRPLAVEALQPGRLPLRVRGRRPGPGRRAARGPQEPRPADARPAAGRDGRRARPTTRTSSEQTRAVRRPAGDAARTALEARRLPDRPLRGVALPVGDPRARTAGTPSPGSPSAASWSRRARSTAPPAREHVRVALTATDERVAAGRPPPGKPLRQLSGQATCHTRSGKEIGARRKSLPNAL